MPDPARVSPDGSSLDSHYLMRSGADEVQLDLFLDYASNVALYPAFQAYFREHRPPLLAIWGRNDPFFLPAGAEAYRRDLPDAEVRFLDTGHFALETHAAEIAEAITGFFGQNGRDHERLPGSMTCTYKVIESPVGKLKLVASDKGLAAILWENDDPDRVRLGRLVEQPRNPILVETERQLRDYFAGKLKAFTVPLDFNGTPFQRQVWRKRCSPSLSVRPAAMAKSPRQIGRPAASRAVGAANGKNPDLDHRPRATGVIGATGKLNTGFAGGLPAKQHTRSAWSTPSPIYSSPGGRLFRDANGVGGLWFAQDDGASGNGRSRSAASGCS